MEKANPVPRDYRSLLEQGKQENLDGLDQLMAKFATTLVIFILPGEFQSKQLQQSTSFTNRVLHLIHNFTAQHDRFARGIVVNNAEQALDLSLAFVLGISNDLRQKRSRVFQKLRQNTFLPTASRIDDSLNDFVAKHVYQEMHNWGTAHNILPADIDILLDHMQQLGNVVEFVESHELDRIAVDATTKQKIRSFFSLTEEENTADIDIINDDNMNLEADENEIPDEVVIVGAADQEVEAWGIAGAGNNDEFDPSIIDNNNPELCQHSPVYPFSLGQEHDRQSIYSHRTQQASHPPTVLLQPHTMAFPHYRPQTNEAAFNALYRGTPWGQRVGISSHRKPQHM